MYRWRLRTAWAAALALAAASPCPALAGGDGWRAEKCRRYARDWREILARTGMAGLGLAFIENHEAFITSGCAAPPYVCPRTERELAIANILVIRAMNAGMASTFLPFSCAAERRN